MTKTRRQNGKLQNQGDGERRSGSDSDATTISDQCGASCAQPVRKLIDKYSTPRKGSARTPITPASNRRMAPPMSAARSVSRPGTSSALRVNNDANRRLALNLDETDPVEVYCRVKPVDTEETCVRILDDNTLALIPPETSNAWKCGNAKEQHYSFKKLFDTNTEQQAIFDEVALPMVKDFLLGKNALLFAYGVTGSGKTYTMSGNSADSGIMPRCLDVVFNSISKHQANKFIFKPDRMNGFESQSQADAMADRQKEMHERHKESVKTPRRNGRPIAAEYGMDKYVNRTKDHRVLPIANEDSKYSVFVTYVEIYNNSVFDLLDEAPIDIRKGVPVMQHKLLREDVNHNVYVNSVTEVEVESPEECFEVYLRGQRRRKMAHTALNTESSRSHSIFNIRLVQAPTDDEGEEVIDNKQINVSQLSLVDLAGSERYTRTQATGDRLKEAGNINNSLMTLRKCMDILRDNQKSGGTKVVPYRESKLTHFLKNYFEGEGCVRMILCLNPKNEDYDENTQVLKFAELTQEIQITRPQEKKPDPIMTPGRVKANQLYKEAKRQLVVENIIDENQLPKSDVQMVFGLGIPIPLCKISKSTEQEVLATLKKALELRVKGKHELTSYIHEKRESFRLRLYGVEREMETLRSENSSYRSHIERLNAEKNKLDNVLRSTLIENKKLEEKNTEQETQIQELEVELEMCKQRLRQLDLKHLQEKECLKSDMDVQRELDAMKTERVLQQEKAKLKAEYRTKEKAFEAVRELVSAIEPATSRTRASRSRTSRGALLELSTTSSESDLPTVSSKSDMDHRRTKSRFMSTPALHHESVQVNPPAARKNALATTPRYGRARSTDRDIWVEHTDRAVIYKAQTVFQPVMKKKKSLNKLGAADCNAMKNASKYCLLTQEPDSDGDIQTKLYKGEINATISGGTNVVIKDVEALKQTSPGGSPAGRKRRSSTSPGGGMRTRRSRAGLGDNEELTHNEIQNRCREYLEGTSSRHSRTRMD